MMINKPDITALSSRFPTVPNLAQGTAPIGSPINAMDNLNHEDIAAINQIAAELLDDPIALQHFCDYIYHLFQQDLARQRTH